MGVVYSAAFSCSVFVRTRNYLSQLEATGRFTRFKLRIEGQSFRKETHVARYHLAFTSHYGFISEAAAEKYNEDHVDSTTCDTQGPAAHPWPSMDSGFPTCRASTL